MTWRPTEDAYQQRETHGILVGMVNGGEWRTQGDEADGTAVLGTDVWAWNRTVGTWQEAERLAEAHMRHLGFMDVRLTSAGADQGVDVLGAGVAAQVKFHARPAGGPDIQRLAGAAHGLPDRVFYAVGFTPAAARAAEVTGVALFIYETTVGAVAPANDSATRLSPSRPGGDERGRWGGLTFDGRRTRSLRWASQVLDATNAPLSNWKRKASRQLEQRQQAAAMVRLATELISSAGSPLNKKRRADGLLRDAEKQLKAAAVLVGAQLK